MKSFEVIKFLMELSSTYSQLGNNIKSGSFARAANAISNSNIEDINSGNDVIHLPGIGGSTKKEIDEFITKGTSDRLEQLRSELKKESQDEKVIDEKLSKIRNLMKKAT